LRHTDSDMPKKSLVIQPLRDLNKEKHWTPNLPAPYCTDPVLWVWPFEPLLHCNVRMTLQVPPSQGQKPHSNERKKRAQTFKICMLTLASRTTRLGLQLQFSNSLALYLHHRRQIPTSLIACKEQILSQCSKIKRERPVTVFHPLSIVISLLSASALFFKYSLQWKALESCKSIPDDIVKSSLGTCRHNWCLSFCVQSSIISAASCASTFEWESMNDEASIGSADQLVPLSLSASSNLQRARGEWVVKHHH